MTSPTEKEIARLKLLLTRRPMTDAEVEELDHMIITVVPRLIEAYDEARSYAKEQLDNINLRAENERLRTTLRFYGLEAAYGVDRHEFISVVQSDRGAIARETLGRDEE